MRAYRFSKKMTPLASVCELGLVIALAVFWLGSSPAKAESPKGGAEAPSTAPGFSIETEMFTYRALESNTEAIACDVAAYLSGSTVSFTDSATGSRCIVKTGNRNFVVVLLPFDRKEFEGFQVWRADMAVMDRLQRVAAREGCQTKLEAISRGASTSAAGSLLSMSPAGPPLALAQSVFGLLASEESATSVGGTIQDQAFMNGLARALRTLNVAVVMPSAYPPYSWAMLDESTSPFLASFGRTFAARECLSGLATKPETTDKDRGRIAKTISDIDTFLATMAGSGSSKPAAAEGTGTGPKSGEGQKPATSATLSTSHFATVLAADGLAVKLGVDPATGSLAANAPPQYILLVKALESGGSVIKHGNILGTKIRYSGGSVGTFALFSMEGDLECAGNVYDFRGAADAKDFEKTLRNFHPNPGQQMIFFRGGCKPQQTK
jgi:hypothetical protein